ncbi:MAG TPA: MgtC/SapB family protein [Thermomicrobiales bacterium]|nr:MgtC/SapB family protein [Thermomicrobiales bacterium]
MTPDLAPTLPALSLLLRLAAAAVLGGLVGLERQRLERAAGLRTHALVAVASSLIMIVSAYGFAGTVMPGNGVVLDPSRVAAQVVSGIGFLGAGVIIFQKNRVRGLDTAASLWGVTGIGLATGGGLFLAAAFGAVFIIGIQAIFRAVERRFFAQHQQHRLSLDVEPGGGRFAAIERTLATSAVTPRRIRFRQESDRPYDRLDLDLATTGVGGIGPLLDALRAIDGVSIASYSHETGWTEAQDLGDLAESDDDDGPLSGGSIDDQGEHRHAARGRSAPARGLRRLRALPDVANRR